MKHYGKNYTEMLKTKNLSRKPSDEEVLDIEKDGYGNKINLHPLDAFDKKRFKEGRLAHIGI